MRNINKKGIISIYAYIMFLGVVIVISGIMTGTILVNHYSNETLAKMKSYYASESGIEEGLLAFKHNSNIDEFVPNDAIIAEGKNKRNVQYTEQKVYKKEIFVEDLVPAGKSIQLPFAKKDLDSRITKFHIAVLKRNTKDIPTSQSSCDTPVFDSSIEVSAYQKANIISTEPLDYNVELSSNWNGCYIGNNSVGKTSLVTYSDPYSNSKVSLIGDKCIVNAKGNVTGAVFEKLIPYTFNDGGDMDTSNDKCSINCGVGICSPYYTQSSEILQDIQGYTKFYTIANNFNWADMSNNGLIVFNIRAIDDDANVAMWATDDAGNPYEIPGRYVNFSALGTTQGGDLNEGLFTRLKLKKKHDNDLLSIFDYSLYSESEFIK